MDPCLQVLLDVLERTPEFVGSTFEGHCKILRALNADDSMLSSLDHASVEPRAPFPLPE
jgi:hypothetical protein